MPKLRTLLSQAPEVVIGDKYAPKAICSFENLNCYLKVLVPNDCKGNLLLLYAPYLWYLG